MCLQLDIPLREVSDRCWLVNESGKLVDLETDSKLDFHFDEMLDKVAEWKKEAAQDSNLLGNLIVIFQCSVGESMSTLLNELQLLFYLLFAVSVTELMLCGCCVWCATEQLLSAHEASKIDKTAHFTAVC